MFVENYRQETDFIMAGSAFRPLPYPKLSNQDWRAWNLFLPFHAATIDRVAARKESLYFSYDIPYALTGEIKKATEYFDKVEIWRKHHGQKDPIAVGLLGSDRYLIARWGTEKLLPFDTLKKTMPLILTRKYLVSPAGALAGLVALSYLAWGLLS